MAAPTHSESAAACAGPEHQVFISAAYALKGCLTMYLASTAPTDMRDGAQGRLTSSDGDELRSGHVHAGGRRGCQESAAPRPVMCGCEHCDGCGPLRTLMSTALVHRLHMSWLRCVAPRTTCLTQIVATYTLARQLLSTQPCTAASASPGVPCADLRQLSQRGPSAGQHLRGLQHGGAGDHDGAGLASCRLWWGPLEALLHGEFIFASYG